MGIETATWIYIEGSLRYCSAQFHNRFTRGALIGSSYDAKHIRISVHLPPGSRNLESRFETGVKPSVVAKDGDSRCIGQQSNSFVFPMLDLLETEGNFELQISIGPNRVPSTVLPSSIPPGLMKIIGARLRDVILFTV